MSFQVMLQQLTTGFGSTLVIFFLTLLFSLPLGMVVYFGRVSRFKPLSWIVKAYISIMRGTPLMLQLLLQHILLLQDFRMVHVPSVHLHLPGYLPEAQNFLSRK